MPGLVASLSPPTLEEFAIAVHHPGQQDVDDVGVDCASAAGLIALPLRVDFSISR